MFIIIYLMTLLKIQNEKELDRIIDNLFSDEEENEEIPLMIPARSKLNMKLFSVPSTMKIGKSCRLHGNIRAGLDRCPAEHGDLRKPAGKKPDQRS
ncbi:MAG: hypothetical protein MZV65_31255 [Chromatiales bacterium]|nr:hypothetical protein [Chromatiales bacterium]